MYVYKKLTAQDIAVVPFNAHKQYDFDSASCSSNKIDHYNTQWTSESISLYTSTSAVYGGDVKNVLKYNQLDHLFYREFPHNHSNTLGSAHYLKQKRNLYEKVNILSIPTGLYGYEIKPGSFYLKTTDGTEVVDDLHGNLLISGTFTSSDYPVDVRGNVFRLDPIKGFKDYDLGVYKDYALKFIDPQHPEEGIKKVFYKRGEIKANAPTTYSTPDGNFEIDDSYFYNPFKYNKINFNSLTESELVNLHAPLTNGNSATINSFNSLDFASNTSGGTQNISNITSEDLTSGKVYKISAIVSNYAGTGDVGFSNSGGISANAKRSSNGVIEEIFTSSGGQPDIFIANGVTAGTLTKISVKEIKSNPIPALVFDSITGSNVVSEHNERYNFNRDDDFAISFYMEPRVLSNPPVATAVAVGDNFQGGIVFHIDGDEVYVVNPFPVLDFHGAGKFWGPGGISINGTSQGSIGDGETFTQNMVNNDPNGAFLGTHVQNKTIGGYSDWWLPSLEEIDTFTQLPNFANLFSYDGVNTFNDLGITGLGSTNAFGAIGLHIVSSNDVTGTFFSNNNNPFGVGGFNLSGYVNGHKSNPLRNDSGFNHLIYLVRRANINTFDNSRRYIIAKSTTRSVIPTVMQGTSEVLNLDSTGGLIETGSNMQPKGIQAQPQFPYEIYMVSQSLHFDRSDGDHTVSISCEVTGSRGSAEKLTHILCQTSASNMEIYFDGVLKSSTNISSKLKPHTQNKANLYIGSKGEESRTDGFDPNYNFKYFNGKLVAVNIYQESFKETEVKNISESINGSPYIGNLFYQNGFATITHPKYHNILSGSTGNGTINKLKFQGTHLMYEHEYQCTVDEHEFNQTFNLSAREIASNNNYNLAGFTTSSYFKPYVTTIGLYNEVGDCLVVGKLGQPIRMSDETDTTFILRWDT